MKIAILILTAAVLLVAAGLVMSKLDPRELTTESRDALALYEAGNQHLISFQWHEATDKLEKAMKLDPDFAMAAAALAEAYGRRGWNARRDSMIAYTDSLAADLVDGRERMLVQLRNAKYKNSALHSHYDSLLTTLEKVAPNELIVLSAVAARAKRDGDDAAAEKVWRRVLEVDPNFASAYNELGYIAFYRNDYDEAIDLLQKYAFLAPGLANPHDSLGDVLMHLGRYEEAEQEFHVALSIQPDYITSLLSLARVYVNRGQIGRGMALLTSIREQVVGTSYERLVEEIAIGIYYVHHLWEPLSEATAKYIANFPDDESSVAYRGIRLTVNGELAAAEAVIDSTIAAWRASPGYEKREAARRRIDSAEAQFQALMCENSDRATEAAAHWDRAISLMEVERSPHDLFFARAQYGVCLLAEGQYRAALEQARTVLETNPRHTRALIIAAEAALAQERSSEARAYIEQLEAALAVADQDYPPLAELAELQRRVQREADNS